eukprot:TRINITY_DN63682_c0_g1_i1.p1 TRINITY_DN63682_c0_g1~~TRINITY_DN63682_c0_g1_i1.p1  ORF type:complete len:415 (+),score=54.93 TRINITY_DN63682_c0_g1_i1:75-1319(+)
MAEVPQLLGRETEPKGTVGLVSSSFAIVCQMAGMGILQLAFMLRQGGWICLALIVVCALSTNYTGKLLIRCCYDEEGNRVNQNYADIGFAAFGQIGKTGAQVFENATLFGVSTLFLILGGKFLEEVLPALGMSTRVWIAVGAWLVSIPVLIFRTVGEMKFVSLLGVAAVGSVVLAVVVEALMAAFDTKHETPHTDLFLPQGFIPAFSAMTLAFAAHAGLPSVEASMRETKMFPASFNLAYGLVMLLYLPVAIIGYAVYGDHVYSPILCSLPRENWVQIVAKVLITAHVLLTYPVLMSLLIQEVERVVGLDASVSAYLPKRSALRLGLVLMTVLVAEFVPYFDTMMSLVGAVCVVMTTFIMPAAFFLKLQARTKVEYVLPVLVVTMGVVGGGVGAVQATIELIDKVSSGADPNDR